MSTKPSHVSVILMVFALTLMAMYGDITQLRPLIVGYSEDTTVRYKTKVATDNVKNESDNRQREDTMNFTSYEYRRDRVKNFYSWFDGPENSTHKLLPNADQSGTILDFAIVGFPKCGTTTMMANLGTLAPMPISDVCTPVSQIVYYSYMNWPKKFGTNKVLRGTKCPAYAGGWLPEFSLYLPRTKLILGIRHPVRWFESFFNMQIGKVAEKSPYELIKPCPRCTFGCSNRLFCLHRGRFHVTLAGMGKTPLSTEERALLAPNDWDGGGNLVSNNITNPIFIYEQRELQMDYVWEDLAKYLSVPFISHQRKRTSRGHAKEQQKIDICDDAYDAFRAIMMPYCRELSLWLLQYLIPVAKDQSRTDVVIPKPGVFASLVKEYENDPCGKLVRSTNGTYVLPNNAPLMIPSRYL